MSMVRFLAPVALRILRPSFVGIKPRSACEWDFTQPYRKLTREEDSEDEEWDAHMRNARRDPSLTRHRRKVPAS